MIKIDIFMEIFNFSSVIVPFWYALATYHAMARPNSPDMPLKGTKKVYLGIYNQLIKTGSLDNSIEEFSCNISNTSASVLPGSPNTRKMMTA